MMARFLLHIRVAFAELEREILRSTWSLACQIAAELQVAVTTEVEGCR